LIQRNHLVVGVGEFSVTHDEMRTIKTFALGSCVAVICLAPRKEMAGLLHVALPEAKINPTMAQARPGMFADTGIPAMLDMMVRRGCNLAELKVKLAGGASILDTEQRFEIGKRNILSVKKILWMYRLGPVAEDVGLNYSRTVTVSAETGQVVISSPGKGEWQL